MLVIDASIAVKFITNEPGRLEALTFLGGPKDIIAPDWIMIEVGHALWRKVAHGLLDRHSALENLNQLPTFFDQLFSANTIMASALHLSFDLNHPLYDCLYLALAIREGGALLTADRKFWNAAKRANLLRHVELLTWAEPIY